VDHRKKEERGEEKKKGFEKKKTSIALSEGKKGEGSSNT